MSEPYRLLRSARLTLSLELTAEGELLVRAPQRLPLSEINRFVDARAGWIASARARMTARAEVQNALSPVELRTRAERILPKRLAAWAAMMGVEPSGLRITGAKKRLGSCSGENHICLSLYLMRWPDEVIDYVLVHELAHVRVKNHSAAFYAEIARWLPDYRHALGILRGQEKKAPTS